MNAQPSSDRIPSITQESEAWRASVIAGLFGLIVSACWLLSAKGDPLVFLALGESGDEVNPYILEILGREDTKALRPDYGHDGKYFLLQACDPFYLTTQYAKRLDRPAYRSQRMLFPLLAGLGGAAPKNAIPWLLTTTNILALMLGAYSTGRLAERLGGRGLLGALFLVNPGLIAEFTINGAGVLALATAVSGALALEEKRIPMAAFWFLLCGLTKEPMLLFVAGVTLLHLIRTRRLPVALVAPTVVGVGLWAIYVRLRLDTGAALDEVREIAMPFWGIIEAIPYWRAASPSEWVLLMAVFGAITWFAIRCFREPPNYLTCGAAGFVILTSLLSVVMCKFPIEICRSVTPVFYRVGRFDRRYKVSVTVVGSRMTFRTVAN